MVAESNEERVEIATPYVPDKAKVIREEFEQFFMSADGELRWQYQHI